MFEVSVRSDVDQLHKALVGFERQIPFATALSITRTAQQVKRDETQEINRVFNNPTRFTLNSVFMRPARKRRLQAEVWLKDISDFENHYLYPHIVGGTREYKRFEKLLYRRRLINKGDFAIPGQGVRLNSKGNVSRGQIQQILSGLGAQFDSAANTTIKSRKRRRRKQRSFRGYFVLSNPVEQLDAGIYSRHRVGSRQTVKTLFIFASNARYKKRFNWFDIAERSIENNFPIQMRIAVADAIRSARKI